jgi:hypothetical protein
VRRARPGRRSRWSPHPDLIGVRRGDEGRGRRRRARSAWRCSHDRLRARRRRDLPAVFATIRARPTSMGSTRSWSARAVRMIHACGMVDLADDVVASDGFAPPRTARCRPARRSSCDTAMVAAGSDAIAPGAATPSWCTLGDPAVPALAAALGTTRNAAAWSSGESASTARSSWWQRAARPVPATRAGGRRGAGRSPSSACRWLRRRRGVQERSRRRTSST